MTSYIGQRTDRHPYTGSPACSVIGHLLDADGECFYCWSPTDTGTAGPAGEEPPAVPATTAADLIRRYLGAVR